MKKYDLSIFCKKFIFLICIGLLIPLSAWSKPLILNQETGVMKLDGYLEYYIDESSERSFEEIQNEVFTEVGMRPYRSKADVPTWVRM